MPLILSGNVASAVAGAYEVANSVRYNDGDSPKMQKTLVTGSNTIGTFSCWVKRCTLGADQALFTSTNDTLWFKIWFHNEDYLRIDRFKVASPYWDILKTTSMKFRDPNAWYHIHVAIDTTDDTAEDRMILTVNGIRVTSFATSTNPAEDVDLLLGTADYVHRIGANQTSGDFVDGYMAEVVWIDGTASAATNFGEFDEDSPTIWKPIDVSGLSLGTNGYYLDFEDSANLGNDANGGTDFTESNLAAADSCTDTPTNNFATLNPLNAVGTGNNPTYSEGNCKAVSSTDQYFGGSGSIGVASGKWYFEVKLTAESTSGQGVIAVSTNVGEEARQNRHIGQLTTGPSVGYYGSNGNKVVDGGTDASYGDSYAAGDIVGIALNCDDNEVVFYKNGTAQASGTAISMTSSSEFWFLSLGDAGSDTYGTYEVNFGNPSYTNSSSVSDANGYGDFEYSVPSGFLALCTKNLGSDGG